MYLIFHSCLEIDDENDEEQQDYPDSEVTFEQAADMVPEENNPAGINSFNESPSVHSRG